MLRAMDEFKSYLKTAYGRDFDIRIGVHYGEVISGPVGFGEDKKVTVIGDTVNSASRIEAINKEAGTRLLISETVYEQVRDNVTVRNYLRLKLRGTSNLITLHEVSDVNSESLKLNITKSEKSSFQRRNRYFIIMKIIDDLAQKLLIQVSQRPGAGVGLYTGIDIPKGTPVCEYKGDVFDLHPEGQERPKLAGEADIAIGNNFEKISKRKPLAATEETMNRLARITR